MKEKKDELSAVVLFVLHVHLALCMGNRSIDKTITHARCLFVGGSGRIGWLEK